MKAFSNTFTIKEHVHLDSFVANTQEFKGNLIVQGDFIFPNSNIKLSTEIKSKCKLGEMINSQHIVNIRYDEEEKCFVYTLGLPVDLHKYEAMSLFCLGRLAQLKNPMTEEQIKENLENSKF